MKLFFLVLAFFIQQVDSAHINNKDGLAVNGYDVVSYFDGKPVKGSKSLAVKHQGITYRFSSASNKEKFMATPEQYIPAYGGWCAYAMGVNGEKVKIDPETFKIIDSKLYLFYNFWGNNTLEPWNEAENTLKTDADKYWNDIIAPKK